MEKVYEYAAAVLAEVKRAIAGKDACITKAFATILAGGHILIEDVPGVGKDNTCHRLFARHGTFGSPCTVYTGRASGRYCRI